MHSIAKRQKENGAVLLVSLIILLIMTVIGTSGITSVTMEERMVSNMYDDNLSFQASESGLRDCEGYLAAMGIDDKEQQRLLTGGTAPDSTTLIWDSKLTPSAAPENVWTGKAGLDQWWQDPAFWTQNGMQYSTTDAAQTSLIGAIQGAVAAEPVCIREEIDFQADDKQESVLSKRGWYHYQATAAANGGDIRSMSVVQSAYFKRLK